VAPPRVGRGHSPVLDQYLLGDRSMRTFAASVPAELSASGLVIVRDRCATSTPPPRSPRRPLACPDRRCAVRADPPRQPRPRTRPRPAPALVNARLGAAGSLARPPPRRPALRPRPQGAPTSNQAERDLRPSKVQQNISGRLTSEQRTRDGYVILGYAATAAKQGRQALAVLRDALPGRPWMPELPAPADPGS
jgi:hypothetical protein